MSDENNIHTNLEEHKDTPLEARPEEPQQMAESESPETEVLQQQQEKGESARKPSTTPKAIRLATISKLLEKHTAQMERVGRMVQPLHTQIDSIAKMIQTLQKQLKSIERQNEFVKQLPYQLKQLQKEMSQVQKDSQKIRLSLGKKPASTKRKNTKRIRKR
jgi:predicted RNase H-like nuclease (RuvC/YqgF family)